MKDRIKRLLLYLLSRASGRHAVLLPAVASGEPALLGVDAPYRVEGHQLTVRLLDPGPGRLDATLLGYQGHFPTRPLWRTAGLDYLGPCDLTVDLEDGFVRLAEAVLDGTAAQAPTRRLSWRLTLTRTDGRRVERQTGHYLAADGKEVDASYYQGENYVDHEAEAAGEADRILTLLAEHGAQAPVLEVGCASGAVLAAFDAKGIKSVGVDYSEFAINQATDRLGPGRAFRCDAERDPLPDPVRNAGPFHTLLLWAVFEHFARPFEVLRRLNEVAAPGALLVINTVNVESLTHRLFGRNWEGYFDWTHHGADEVGVASLRRELPRLGWRIERLTTHLAWTGSADPLHATLRDWYAADARFRQLLTDREVGDLVTLVARRPGDEASP